MAASSRPTQVDVARLAGVSRQTVSLVVQDDPRVSPGRRAAVRRAMRELGYVPNVAARVLAARRTKVIGIVIAQLDNPFNAELAEALRRACDEVGLIAFLSSVAEERGDVLAAVQRFLQLGVDGLILVSPLATDEELDSIGRRTPTVVLIRNAGPESVDLVRVDDVEGGRLTASHLLERGYRPVVHVGRDRLVHGDSTSARLDGYRRAVRAAGLAPVEITSRGDELIEDLRRLVETNPTGCGLCCHNDLMALSVQGCLHGLGLRPGVDVGITGFDDTSISAFPGVDLTTVDARIDEISAAAVRVLDERCDGRTRGVDVVIPHSLVIRGSTQGLRKNVDGLYGHMR